MAPPSATMRHHITLAIMALLSTHSTGTCQPVFPLDGRVIRGNLTPRDQGALPPDHLRHGAGFGSVAHVISAEAGTVVEVTLQADFDAQLLLLSPEGNVVAENDDFQNLHTSRVIHRLEESGPHRAVVTSFSLGVEGEYLIAARCVSHEVEVPEAFPPLIDDTMWLALIEGDRLEGTEVHGELRAGDRSTLPRRAPPFPEDVALRAHPLTVTGECVQSFELWAEFDGVLTLLAPDGRPLVRSDDYRSPERSRITDVRFRVPGEYHLVVSGYASGETGAYTLIVGPALSDDGDQSG